MTIKRAAATKDAILNILKRQGTAGSRELSQELGITRQALNPHLRSLVESGEIFKTGSTRNSRYHYGSAAEPPESFATDYLLDGLDEDRVYRRLSLSFNLRQLLRPNVESIAHYAFTEMLNNAIDHSGSKKVAVRAELGATSLAFEIKDWGKGVYASIADKFGLANEHEGMVELVKGRTTTMPQAHSGEGIFFTSRVTDRLTLRSHKIELCWDRHRDDVFVSAPRFSKGTGVRVEINRHSRLRAEQVFARFAPGQLDYAFEKTHVHIKLLRQDYVSRSEAKRLLINLDKFKIIELDFKDVTAVGQGFADEVFRVFAARHPGIQIKPVRASKAIEAMIRHVAA